MAQRKQQQEAVDLQVTLGKEFEGDVVAHVFDRNGNLLTTQPVREQRLQLPLSEAQLRRSRVIIAPQVKGEGEVTPASLARLGGYEVVLSEGFAGPVRKVIEIPELSIDRWYLCACVVRGRVVRPVGTGSATQDLPVCGARVHICEVDHWPVIIAKLPDPDILRLRDDLIDILRHPRLPQTRPPFPFPPGPGPDPGPLLARSPLRLQDRSSVGALAPQLEQPRAGFAAPGSRVALNPQPLPPRDFLQAGAAGFDPQPEPSGRFLRAGSEVAFNPQPEPPSPELLSSAQLVGLQSASLNQVRNTLIAHPELLVPYLCYWPWWWSRFTCDELAVVDTDAFGRFEKTILYPCSGDHPDIYFWVEYPIGGVWQTVWKPPVPCWTHWNYACGTEVTIRVTDPRVPSCGNDPNLPGLIVSVMSIGRDVSIKEVQGAGAGTSEGLTTGGAPLGGKLEPRVWFSRSNLIAAGITHYRWSYRRLTGPDGATPDVGPWTIMTRVVGRHYAVVGPGSTLAFPFEVLGPDGGNKFRIQPTDPTDPAAVEWWVLDEREDLATAHFETTLLPHGLTGTPTECEKAARTAGQYELKLELLHANGSIVDWTAAGVGLKIADDPAPFGTAIVHTINAPAYYRVLDGAGHLVGYRMVLRVDNNCCRADIKAVSGPGLTVDDVCGFIEYAAGASATISFNAEHPWGFATFSFGITRGTGTPVAEGSAAGVAGAATAASTGGVFNEGPAFRYSRTVAVSTLLASGTAPGGSPCQNAAFAEVLHVWAMATDGYGRLYGLDRGDAAAFALAQPCPGRSGGH